MNPLGQNRPRKSRFDVQKVHSEKTWFLNGGGGWGGVLKTLKNVVLEQTELNMNPLGQNRPGKSIFDVQKVHSEKTWFLNGGGGGGGS